MAKALRVELELPDDAFGEDFDQETFCAKVREAAVMRLLREHRISQGKDAELLGLSRDQCLGLMASHGVPVVDLSPEELERELRVGHSRCRSRRADSRRKRSRRRCHPGRVDQAGQHPHWF